MSDQQVATLPRVGSLPAGRVLAAAARWSRRQQTRLDPVQFRVALPAADPPDNLFSPDTQDGTDPGAATGRFMTFFPNYRDEWLGNIRADILSGLVVALALIPEAIAFSIIAGVDPKIGLYR
jgi:SulP family sulfate permease